MPILTILVLINMYNELLEELKKLNSGDVKLESFAYADDVSLFSSTVTGLQNLSPAGDLDFNPWKM